MMSKALEIRDPQSKSIGATLKKSHAEARIKEFSLIKDNHVVDDVIFEINLLMRAPTLM